MSVLKVVEAALDRKIDTPQSIDDLRQRGSTEWLERLWIALRPLSRISQDERQTFVPSRKPNELQPYFPHHITGDRRFVGDLPAYEGLNSVVATPDASALFARHLLYCNRIALDDPTWWIVCDNIGTYVDNELVLADNDKEKLRARKDAVLSWLELMQRLRPLLEAERIILIPPDLGLEEWQAQQPSRVYPPPPNLATSPEIKIQLNEFLEMCVSYGYDPSFIENIDLSNDAQRQLMAQGWFGSAIDDMRTQLLASLKYQKRLDLSPVLSFHALALNAILEHGEFDAPKNAVRAPGYARELGTLIRLPVLLELGDDPSRLVSLATNEARFADWRVGMGRALEKITAYDPAKAGYEGIVRLAFESELHDAVEHLRQDRDRATWGGALRSSISDIGISAIGAGAAGGIAAASGLSIAVAAIAPFGLIGAALAYTGRAVWTYSRGGAARARGEAAGALYEILSGGH